MQRFEIRFCKKIFASDVYIGNISKIEFQFAIELNAFSKWNLPINSSVNIYLYKKIICDKYLPTTWGLIKSCERIFSAKTEAIKEKSIDHIQYDDTITKSIIVLDLGASSLPHQDCLRALLQLYTWNVESNKLLLLLWVRTELDWAKYRRESLGTIPWMQESVNFLGIHHQCSLTNVPPRTGHKSNTNVDCREEHSYSNNEYYRQSHK